ncbi:uncharacterized protein LOC124130997 [Haliotis rufescens]|uniref:uncharacterized protein LOC124130997 n=1 Tax=Haliotis rufescens TaxID=6454 RepID=UPI00201F7020|nr:uncharacterized protein LOC124130997 [Haliotis rufescens]
MHQRNCSGNGRPRFPKREPRARPPTRRPNPSHNWASSQRSVSIPNCHEKPQNSTPVRSNTTPGTSDTGIHWRLTQMYSEGGCAKSKDGVSSWNCAEGGASAKVVSRKVEPATAASPARDNAPSITNVKRNSQSSTSGNKAELGIEQAAKIALPSSPSDEDVSGKARVIAPKQVATKTLHSAPARSAVVKPGCSLPSGESAPSDLEARRQKAIQMVLELRLQQDMQNSSDDSWSEYSCSSDSDTDSCWSTCSETSITDTVNVPTYPDEESRVTAVLRARLAAGHVPQARKSRNLVSLDEMLHAIRYLPQPRAFAPWFDEDMVDFDNNVIGLLRPPARPRAPYVGDVIATLVPPMARLSLKHAQHTGDDKHVTPAKSRKRQNDDVPDVRGIKRSRTQSSGTTERINAVTCGKRKAVECDDILHAAKRTRH